MEMIRHGSDNVAPERPGPAGRAPGSHDRSSGPPAAIEQDIQAHFGVSPSRHAPVGHGAGAPGLTQCQGVR